MLQNAIIVGARVGHTENIQIKFTLDRIRIIVYNRPVIKTGLFLKGLNMKYEMTMQDEPEWINTIRILSNTKDVLHIEIDCRPKYLDAQLFSESGADGEFYGIYFFKTEDTLRADKDGWCEINFKIEHDKSKIMYSYLQKGRYTTSIIFAPVSSKRSKLIYRNYRD